MAQELADLNPWWRSANWATDDADLRNVRGTGLGYRSECLDDLTQGGLYLVRGPRRVGKTVASKQKIAELTASGVSATAIVRIAADGWSADDLRTVIQNVPLPRIPEGIRRWWFIDEVTGVTGDWVSTVKWLRDNFRPFAEATVVLTGSNAAHLTAAIGQLAGRRGDVERADRTMLPIGFRTFVRLLLGELPQGIPRLELGDLHSSVADDAYHALLPWLAELVRLWDLYLVMGGFPVAVVAAHRGQPVPRSFVDDLFNVIFKDVFRDSLASETTTTDLFARLMEGMSNPVNHSQVGNAVGVSYHVVERHVTYLHNAYLAWTCPQKNADVWLPLPKAQPKVYASDPLIARIPHLRHSARPDIDLTVLTEMALGMAIRRAADDTGHAWAGDEFLFYHKTPSRKEIDFVSELLADSAIEAKFIQDGSWKSSAATVDASPWKGILATRNVLDTTAQDKAWAVPAGILAYLVDT